jgi:hypothetical protein
MERWTWQASADVAACKALGLKDAFGMHIRDRLISLLASATCEKKPLGRLKTPLMNQLIVMNRLILKCHEVDVNQSG